MTGTLSTSVSASPVVLDKEKDKSNHLDLMSAANQE